MNVLILCLQMIFFTFLYIFLYHQVKDDIPRGQRHAVMSDAWTLMTAQGYITTMCHYIVDDETKDRKSKLHLESRVLDTERFENSHKAENWRHEAVSSWNT